MTNEQIITELRAVIAHLHPNQMHVGAASNRLESLISELEKNPPAVPDWAIFLRGNVSEGFTAHGPYSSADDAFSANEGHEGWMMHLVKE